MDKTMQQSTFVDVALEQGQEHQLRDHLEAIHVRSTLDQEVIQAQGAPPLSPGTAD
jgi:23S rRNA-/tRNA-specific pseudouridylate synthase